MTSATARSQRSYTRKAEQFATTVRELRRHTAMTLQTLADRSGLSASTLSKIENGQLSPSYETLLRLVDGLGVDVAELFHTQSHTDMASGRRSITRRGQGTPHSSAQYQYEMLCAELSRKQFIPLVTTVTARSVAEFEQLPRHEGEEFIYVLSGAVELHSQHYEPARLEQGDGCYFDSNMGHACISVSKNDAVILWVTSRGPLTAPPRSRNALK